MGHKNNQNLHQRPLRRRIRTQIHVPPPKKKRGKFSKPYPKEIRQNPNEVKSYWNNTLPSAIRKIAKLRKKGHKATAIWIDESIITLHAKLVRVWHFKPKKIRREYKFDRKEKTVLLTTVDLDGNTHIDFANTANTRAFIHLISWITKQYKDHKLIYIFLDNARYHSPTDNLPPNIKFIWLPRYAPECNFVEQFHRLIKRELGLNIFTSIEDVKVAMAKYDGLVRPSLVRKARQILQRYTNKSRKRHL